MYILSRGASEIVKLPGREGPMPIKELESDSQARRARLTRERILAKALEIVDRDGLEALSMRHLAAELDATAMSLYNHVPSKEAVLEGITEVLLGEIDLSAVEGDDWAESLKAGHRSFREVLLRHPSALPLVSTKPIAGPDAFRPVEVSLDLLRRAGFDPENALRAHWALVGYTLGHVGFQCTNPLASEQAMEDLIERKTALPPEQFPRILETLPHAIDCDYDGAFEFGLDTIIEGLKSRLLILQSR
jgi:AcrR family transcriptional regulator